MSIELDSNDCYRAVQARDVRFDGRFFTGVATTGIYCRPICPAKTPKLENCRFFSSAAAAEAAGYRPCLRCRPEVSPDLARWQGTSTTIARALDLLAQGALDGGGSVNALAERLGIGDRQLRRLFLEHVGVSPISVAQTRRLLFAKQLLRETHLPVTDVAVAAGFNSLRRFNSTVRTAYGQTPSELRQRCATESAEGTICLAIPYAPPYDFEGILRFLRARSIVGVEQVGHDRYLRSIAVDGQCGWIEVRNLAERNQLAATICFPDVRALNTIAKRISRVFDTRADIQTINCHLIRDPQLAPLLQLRPGLRTPGGWDGFELAVRAVLGQQITVSAARHLAEKLVRCFGSVLPADIAERSGLTHVFATPESLAAADLSILGMPGARVQTLRSLARAAAADPRLFERAQSLEMSVEKLRSLPGIGEWTAQYIALRALRESDAFPHSDLGLLRSLQKDGVRLTPAVLLARAEQWRPWRAYAAQHLWAKDELDNRKAKDRTNEKQTNEKQTSVLPRYSSHRTRRADDSEQRRRADQGGAVGR